MSEAVCLKVENLHVELQKKSILKDVSFAVAEASCVGIIGPNGSGKSTLLQAMLGFLPAARGRVEFFGRDISTIPSSERSRGLAYVGQDYTGVQTFDVKSFLQLAYFPWQEILDFSEWQSECERLCRDFMLTDKLQRPLGTLSGGERQRACLVQALLQRPQLLLLDEITNHLDIAFQLESLRYVRAQPITKVLVLHDINLAVRFCDWLVLLKEGRCLGSGRPEEVLTKEVLGELFGVPCDLIKEGGRIRFVMFA